ncbi:MAG: hypothetical protein VKL42_13445 [Snowella sp.]|nr:hypothetical protein [Snowella sp.]
MESYRFVTIGIHHYRFFPPLGGSESCLWDLQNFLHRRLKLSEKQALLFSDLRSFGKRRIIYPNGNNLRKALQRRAQVIFFQGYATQFNGEDYLLPIDAEPDNLQQTAIPLRSLFDSFLLHHHASTPLLLLDVTPLTLGNPVSNQGLLQAKALGINLVAKFNSRLGGQQELGQLFLEAMGYYHPSLTLDLLEMYLRDKLEARYSDEALIILSRSHQDRLSPMLPSSGILPWAWGLRRNPTTQPAEIALEPLISSPLVTKSAVWIVGLLASLVLLVILLGVIAQAGRWLVGMERAKSKTMEMPISSAINPTVPQLEQAKSYLQWQQASVFIRAIAELRKIPPDAPMFPQAQNQISLWSQIILEIAQGRAVVGNLQDAIAAAELVPKDQAALYHHAQAKIQDWQKQYEQSRLDLP